MRDLKRMQFGNPVLREVAQVLSASEVASTEVQQLISNMRSTLAVKKLGIGLAAPQIGRGIALAVVLIQPTKHRPNVESFEAVLINPKIIETYGRKRSEWEGCISAGSNGTADLFAKVPRYGRVKVGYYDEKFKKHIKTFTGLVAQHEIDHLYGKLFVDRVKDPTTYMTYTEYLKRIKNEKGS